MGVSSIFLSLFCINNMFPIFPLHCYSIRSRIFYSLYRLLTSAACLNGYIKRYYVFLGFSLFLSDFRKQDLRNFVRSYWRLLYLWITKVGVVNIFLLLAFFLLWINIVVFCSCLLYVCKCTNTQTHYKHHNINTQVNIICTVAWHWQIEKKNIYYSRIQICR